MQTGFQKRQREGVTDCWRISIDQCTDNVKAGYIVDAMGGPPICNAFIMVGKSFHVPAMVFYPASDANKDKLT